MINSEPYKVSFSYPKKVHPYKWSCYKPQFVLRQTQPFLRQVQSLPCRSRKDLFTIVPTQIHEFFSKISVGFRETVLFAQKCESVKFHLD